MFALRKNPAGFPMAPSVEEWEALSPSDRAAVVELLPGEVTYDEMAMPEGDRHSRPKVRALDVLHRHFARQRRRVYLATELPTYYPAEPRFAPDLCAVLDAEDVERDKWVVSAEGQGLDWVLEIHVGGDRKKDAVRNIERYARLGIPEYFLYDRARNQLLAFRLATPEARSYSPILPNHGRYESHVLGLEIQVDKDRLRFYDGATLLLEGEQLQGMYDAAHQRAEEAAQRAARAEQLAAQERQHREEEARRREAAEQEVARLRAELERLRR